MLHAKHVILQEIAPYSLSLHPLPRDFSRKSLKKPISFITIRTTCWDFDNYFTCMMFHFFFSWQVCKHAIHGDAKNRWFDKAISLLVFKSGRLATQCDVSVLTKTAFCSCKKVSILPHRRGWKFLGGGWWGSYKTQCIRLNLNFQRGGVGGGLGLEGPGQPFETSFFPGYLKALTISNQTLLCCYVATFFPTYFFHSYCHAIFNC